MTSVKTILGQLAKHWKIIALTIGAICLAVLLLYAG